MRGENRLVYFSKIYGSFKKIFEIGLDNDTINYRKWWFVET